MSNYQITNVASNQVNDRGQVNYTSIMDPVLGPLNTYSRGGPAALSPLNSPTKDLDPSKSQTSALQYTYQEQELAALSQTNNINNDCSLRFSRAQSPSQVTDLASSSPGTSIIGKQTSSFQQNNRNNHNNLQHGGTVFSSTTMASDL